MRVTAVSEGHADQLDPAHLFPVATVKYMGSKRSLIPLLAPRLAAMCPPGATVADLFAGTHVVGYAMSRRNRIVGVDTQGYSRVLGSALLRDRVAEVSTPELVASLEPHVRRQVSAVGELYDAHMRMERRLLNALLTAGIDADLVEEYASFQADLPDPSSWSDQEGRRCERPSVSELQRLVEVRRSRPKEFPYLLMTAYYANAYFGLGQAILLDGLRYAIDQEFGSRDGRDVCLAALLSAASNCTSTPGHFAMWRVIRTTAGARDIARFRARDPLDYFKNKLAELMAVPAERRHEHELVTTDAVEFVRSYDSPVGVAYVDPPYSPVHYSRFYHVLEELVDYDYPPVFFGGRFPADRYISRWSIRSQAGDAFKELLEALAERGWPVIISYGSRGVVSEATLIRLCQSAFGNAGVDLEHVVTRHASMGRADRGARAARELLITCRPKRRRNRTAA